MKIGIITQPLHSNYGGLLQNYALQKVLRDNNHDSITIDWDNRRTSFVFFIAKEIICFFKNKILRKDNKAIQYTINDANYRIIARNNLEFINKYISRTYKVFSTKGFLKETKRRTIDVLIAGSDQVWRMRYAGRNITNMYLGFAKDLNVKRIAYAASFGTDTWEYTERQTYKCKKLAKKFDLITVREDSAIELCMKHLNVSSTHVLDPTMLHDKGVYRKIFIDNNTPKSKGNLFHYILDPNNQKKSLIQTIARKKNLTPFTVMPKYQAENRTKENIDNDIENCVFPGIDEWLRAFEDAEMVICDSFHGCVFSIIFNKPFWVISNESRGNARFDSLLRTFGLQNRLISVSDSINEDAPIDWIKVNTILEEKRSISKTLLLNALK